MIAHIHHQYIFNCSPQWTAKLVVTLAANSHMIDCDTETQQWIEQCVNVHAGTADKELVTNTSLYEITSLKRKYLTTIEIDGTFTNEKYINLFSNPSLVLVENGPYEWPVYKMIIDVYKNDRDYKNIFTVLLKAVNGPYRTLQEYHAGGNGSFIPLIKTKEKSPEYGGLTKLKIYAVTDSDRVSEVADYLPTPKSIYSFFCGVDDKADIDRNNIDTLEQPLYHWHMWRKRAIENYFPPESYENINLDASKYKAYNLPERFFQKVDTLVDRYKKNDLENVARTMSRKDYQNICDKLIINGKEISEIQLFLLKMAKVV